MILEPIIQRGWTDARPSILLLGPPVQDEELWILLHYVNKTTSWLQEMEKATQATPFFFIYSVSSANNVGVDFLTHAICQIYWNPKHVLSSRDRMSSLSQVLLSKVKLETFLKRFLLSKNLFFMIYPSKSERPHTDQISGFKNATMNWNLWVSANSVSHTIRHFFK